MKQHVFLLGGLLLLPAVVLAATVAAKLTFNGKPVAGKALVIGGVPYVRAVDVAKMTGLKTSYDAKTQTISFSGQATAAAPGGSAVGEGGTTQRAGNDGLKGQLLVTPQVAIRLDSLTQEDRLGKSYTVARGVLRNSSSVRRYYEISDAAVVTKSGDTIKWVLQAVELNKSSLVDLQRGEEVKMQIFFPEAGLELDRAVVTIKNSAASDYLNRKETVFRVKLDG